MTQRQLQIHIVWAIGVCYAMKYAVNLFAVHIAPHLPKLI